MKTRTGSQGLQNRLRAFSCLWAGPQAPRADGEGIRSMTIAMARLLTLQALREMGERGITDRVVFRILDPDPGLLKEKSVLGLYAWLLRHMPMSMFKNRGMRALGLARFMALKTALASNTPTESLRKTFAAWVVLLTDILGLRVITAAGDPGWWDDDLLLAPRDHPHLVTAASGPVNLFPFVVDRQGIAAAWTALPGPLDFQCAAETWTATPAVAVEMAGWFARLLAPGAARWLLQAGGLRAGEGLVALEEVRQARNGREIVAAIRKFRYLQYRIDPLIPVRNHYLDYLEVSGKAPEMGPGEWARSLESLVSRVPGMRAPYDDLLRLFRRTGRIGRFERWLRLRRRVVLNEQDIKDAAASPDPGMSGSQHIQGDKMEMAVLKDMRKLSDSPHEQQVIGRDTELMEALEIMGCMQRGNLMIVGEPGVGKTAFVHHLVRVTAHAESELADRPVWRLDLNALIAGVQYRGQLEEKLIHQLDIVARDGGVLFVDDVHEFLYEGLARHSLADLGVMLKPYLDQGDFRVIAATTPGRYSRMEEGGGVFVRYFQKLDLRELDLTDVERILESRAAQLNEFHAVRVDAAGVSRHLELVKQFFRDRMLPDKALALLDRTCARVARGSGSQCLPRVSGEDFLATLADARGVELAAISAPLQQRLRHLDAAMRRSIVGQDHVLAAIMRRMVPARMGLKINPDRPDGVFLFIGPTGVGKTETARVLCRELYGDERRLLRIDMSEYMEEIAVTRLVGAAPGYVGYDEGNQLIDDMLQDPYRVVLLDEIEKAHPNLINIFLQVFDSGLITDSRGRRAYFDKAVIIMTSNVGSTAAVGTPIGFPESGQKGAAPTRTAQARAMKRFFRPEFLNRVDEIVTFHSLTMEHARRIVRIHLHRLNQRFIPRGLEIRCSRAAVERLAELGFSAEYGAREILRTIEKEVMRPVAQSLLGSNRPVHRVHVGVNGQGRLTWRRSYRA